MLIVKKSYEQSLTNKPLYRLLFKNVLRRMLCNTWRRLSQISLPKCVQNIGRILNH